ncbi:UDP-glucose 4-epimerase GalE [Candidatus Williamhamiltonella defendens]|uniref:UDP-glucose 4-epimerase n=2 Tax=Candidatus Williamhamiltonella defendens TaxID=138072 RepID=A0A2D3T5N1_9ENTR|nr:UDP-glucose 4-epimerase GalE [Candidatus Hamiltonella defensa]ACQ66959.1 UDP-galactose 4-epimerase [Candidatus Hamiltonella defensa 5AT (Acyrthosiphon pisum)]ASV32926.1 UDP-glucose 4-epimerase GalE [Candidatus Hamiltonella defensa]ATW21756.1 UDP-glucose 4-epimerase GalE [Candidatus Hamiltonella defensa]ATW29125.1 UDP-glucose 4-epimerase GalE [Candidatus Hamiltonella defensa]ATW31105.1 UDP-glucose 4-epimerase GalE [Candidatus Hamiltonella defensa]
MNNVKVLVTGGLGYIGSHTCVQMIEQGVQPVILDNLCNANPEVLNRIETITGTRPTFYEGDVRDKSIIDAIFTQHNITSVLHFAGLKAVGESVQKPIEYYDNNVYGTLVLVQCMQKAGVKSLIFSSSATVYGDPEKVPLTEQSKVGATTNPYGTSKYMVERVLTDLHITHDECSITLLRYFNPVGAHQSGLIGEDFQGIPNNLMPYIAQVAVGRYKEVMVFGVDYPTLDGTGVRDYIHVMDLADAHITALNHVSQKPGLHIYNLGTGKGTSVLEMIAAFEQVVGKTIQYKIVGRRSGDIAECWSSPAKAFQDLGWKAKYSLQEMVDDSWRWQSQNPNGYSTVENINLL